MKIPDANRIEEAVIPRQDFGDDRLCWRGALCAGREGSQRVEDALCPHK